MPSTSSQLQAKCTLKKASIYFSSEEAWGEVGKEEGGRGVSRSKKRRKTKSRKKRKERKAAHNKLKITNPRFVKTRRRTPWLWANSAREWESVQGERRVSSCRSHLAKGNQRSVKVGDILCRFLSASVWHAGRAR